jgi:hypothetical protein
MTDSTGHRRPQPLVLAVLVAGAAVVLQALLVPLFSGIAANLEPRDLPVVVAGPPPAAAEFAGRLEAAEPGAFEVTTVADEAAADAALRDREAYAAFVLGPSGPSLHTASAASPTVAAALTQAAAQLGGGQPLPVVDIVPTDPDDPRGAGFASGFLPLAMTSMVAGILLALLVRGRGARLLGLVIFAVLAGPVGTAVLQSWLGLLSGDFLANSGVIALFALAASATVAGLAALLGRAGIGLGVLLVFLLGNPLSAVSAAPELLPQPWGAVGQWLPVGAGGTLLRSTVYFDGAGGTQALWVLIGYAAIGLALAAVGRATLAPAPHPARHAEAAGRSDAPAHLGRGGSAANGGPANAAEAAEAREAARRLGAATADGQ